MCERTHGQQHQLLHTHSWQRDEWGDTRGQWQEEQHREREHSGRIRPCHIPRQTWLESCNAIRRQPRCVVRQRIWGRTPQNGLSPGFSPTIRNAAFQFLSAHPAKLLVAPICYPFCSSKLPNPSSVVEPNPVGARDTLPSAKATRTAPALSPQAFPPSIIPAR